VSALETHLALLIEAEGLPEPEREWRFHATRRWRFDFAWPEQRVAVEVQGGIWTHGRHTRGIGYQRDCSKYNEAQLMGWRVLLVTGHHIEQGKAICWLKRALAGDCDQAQLYVRMIK